MVDGKPIDITHKNNFFRLLGEIPVATLPLDRARLHEVINHQQYWPVQETRTFQALTLDASQAYEPFRVLVGVHGRPRYCGELSFSIMILRVIDFADAPPLPFTPVNFHLFPNGRRILEIFGLVIDSHQEWTQARIDRSIWLSSPTFNRLHAYPHLRALAWRLIVMAKTRWLPQDAADYRQQLLTLLMP